MGINEIYRIKELMLYEQFGGNEKIVPKYVNKVIDRVGEVPFERFFNGEATLREFRGILIKKIKQGDYGNDFSQVSKNLQYLKRISSVLGTLEREYKKDPEKFDGLDGFLFGGKGNPDNPLDGLNEKVLYGDFCKDCRSTNQVQEKLNEVIEGKKKIDKIEVDRAKEIEEIKRRVTDPVEAERMLDKLYGDTSGLLSFFTKGHIRRGQDILDKYGLRDSTTLSMGKHVVLLELLKPIKLEVYDDNETQQTVMSENKGKKLRTEYFEEEDVLIHKTKGERFTIEIDMTKEPTEGDTYDTKVSRIRLHRGSVIQTDPKGANISFKILKIGEESAINSFEKKSKSN